MKKLFALLFGITLGITSVIPFALAQGGEFDLPVSVHVFERDDCTHCIDQKAFLAELSELRTDFTVEYHNVYDSAEKDTFNQLTEALRLPKVTPLTVVGPYAIQGFSTSDVTGVKIIEQIDAAKGIPFAPLEVLIETSAIKYVNGGGAGCPSDGSSDCEVATPQHVVNIPLLGPTDIGKYSLPTISLILGFVDGFNPCAMWVLVMFLVILMEIGSRKRMFQVAGLFLLAEAIMYYLILNVWMFTWDFIGLDKIVTPLVGLVALGAGSYFLHLFWKNDTTCNVGSLETKRKAQDRMRTLAAAELTIATAAGILILAFSVNIIEFACSIGIPQTFTKLLDMNYLSFAGKQLYNFLYIIMYMVDDLIVFGLAIWSFDKIGLTTAKYTRASHLIGGVIMVILGLLFLFKPSALVFGF